MFSWCLTVLEDGVRLAKAQIRLIKQLMADSGQLNQCCSLVFIVFIERKWVFGLCCITKSARCVCMYLFSWWRCLDIYMMSWIHAVRICKLSAFHWRVRRDWISCLTPSSKFFCSFPFRIRRSVMHTDELIYSLNHFESSHFSFRSTCQRPILSGIFKIKLQSDNNSWLIRVSFWDHRLTLQEC